MDTYRNGIYVTGLADGADLPKAYTGQIIHYSDVENISIPANEPDINKLVRVSVGIRLYAKRIVMTPYGYLIVLDGLRDLVLHYIPAFEPQKVNQLKMELPYHAFAEIPNDQESFDQIKAYIMDACFDLRNPKLLYGFFVYSLFIPIKSKSQDNNETLSVAPVQQKPIGKTGPEYPLPTVNVVSKKDNIYDKVISDYFQSFDNDQIFRNNQP